MTSIGLKQSKVDNCLFFKVEGSRIVVLVIIYVDDILIATSRSEDMRFIQTKLKMSFKMKDMGDLNFFLRMEVTYNQKEGFLQLSQVGYAEKILERFNMTKAKPVATPLALGVNLDAEDTDLDHQFPYREAVGSLMYLMLGTGPDLCFSIGMLSRYLDKLGERFERSKVYMWIHLYCWRTIRYFLEIDETEISCYINHRSRIRRTLLCNSRRPVDQELAF
jgi:hypothetical protein